MIKLYTDEEFKLAKSNFKLKLECEKCHEVIIKEKRVINYGLKGYDGRQNDLCKKCFFTNKIIILKDICYNCKGEFEYKKSSGRKSDIKLCGLECRQEHLEKCNSNKREIINKKISIKLKGKLGNNYVYKNCKECNIEFCNLIGHSEYCCDICKDIWLSRFYKSDEHRNKMSLACKGKSGGLREGGGFTKMYEYINIHNESMMLNMSEIEISKSLDNLKLNWIRNKVGFEYIDIDGNNRKYYPDFYVKDFDIYVEYKGFVTERMEHKMKDALDKNNFDLLIIYSNNKRYRYLGLNDDQVKNDNNIIIEKIKEIKMKTKRKYKR